MSSRSPSNRGSVPSADTPTTSSRPAFVVSRLAPECLDRYLELTDDVWSRLDTDLTADSSLLAVGASRFGQPIGLALAVLPTGSTHGTVLSVVVKPSYHGIGVGRALRTALDRLLAECGCQQISVLAQGDGASS